MPHPAGAKLSGQFVSPHAGPIGDERPPFGVPGHLGRIVHGERAVFIFPDGERILHHEHSTPTVVHANKGRIVAETANGTRLLIQPGGEDVLGPIVELSVEYVHMPDGVDGRLARGHEQLFGDEPPAGLQLINDFDIELSLAKEIPQAVRIANVLLRPNVDAVDQMVLDDERPVVAREFERLVELLIVDRYQSVVVERGQDQVVFQGLRPSDACSDRQQAGCQEGCDAVFHRRFLSDCISWKSDGCSFPAGDAAVHGSHEHASAGHGHSVEDWR